MGSVAGARTRPGTETFPSVWDVIVVGAGPAGAVTAYSLARRGASVLLVDRQRFPRWKVCGACVSPGALDALESVGLGGLAAESGAVPLRDVSLFTPGARARIPLQGSVALSRGRLDGALVEAAVAHGVRFRPSTRASLAEVRDAFRAVLLESDGARSTHRARIVVDASGLGGGLPRARAEGDRHGGTEWAVAPGSRVGVGATFDDPGYDLGRGRLHMVIGRAGYVGLVRVEDGVLNVGAAVDPGALRGASPAQVVAGILAGSGRPALAGRLVDGWRGTPALTRSRHALGAQRLFRVGDAAGYVEPFTGEGMCWALSASLELTELVGSALHGWQPRLLERWVAYHRGHLRRSRRMCRVLAWGLRRPRLAALAVGLVAREPLLARPFVREAAARPSTRAAEAA